jgi:hypothetical protein
MTVHDTQISTHSHTHTMIDPLVLSVSLVVFGLISYFLCLALALAFPPMAASMEVLYPAMFPGFVWLTASSVAWGALLLSVAALYVGCGFALVYNAVSRLVHAPGLGFTIQRRNP